MLSEKKLWFSRGLIAAVALLCLLAGIFRGEAALVLQKASYICLECIGIG